MENSVATLNDDDIIQDILNRNNKLETEDNSDIEEIKISLKEGEDALRKPLSFLEQQDNNNINIHADDLLVVRRLINHVVCYRKLLNIHIDIHNKFVVIFCHIHLR